MTAPEKDQPQHSDQSLTAEDIDNMHVIEEEEDEDSPEGMEGMEGLNFGDLGEAFANFDPMQTIGQFLVTQNGETIPEVLGGIRDAIQTLTKVLNKISKTLAAQAES
jgi:hypothetical protein